VGVTDLLEVEIQDFEHNGQSKGYCKVWTGSEASSKRIYSQLGKLTVNGRKPDVRNDRHGMDFFEKKINPDYETKEEKEAKAQSLKMKSQPIMPPVMLSKYDQSLTPTLNSPINMKINGNMPNMSSLPNLAGLPNMPGMPNLANMMNNLPNPLAGLPPPPGLSHSMGSLPPPPTFSSSKSINSILAKQNSSSGSNLSLRDFEKLVDNNREICSNAISKALDLADGKDYTGAVETLQHAVNAVKHSKIANDDRSKALIGSVQETMMSIEEKKKGASREKSPVGRVVTAKSRRRSRSRSPRHGYKDRHGNKVHTPSKRERSRSPSDYRSRGSESRSGVGSRGRRYDDY
jgi:hypothetical protein